MDRRQRAIRVFALALCLGAVHAGATDGSRPVCTNELTFDQFYVTPVGPRGLQTTSTLRRLDGQRICITGYVIEDNGARDTFILSPVPLHASAHAEEQGDDLPAAHALVEAGSASVKALVQTGRVRLVGTLHLGRVDRSDGRAFWARIVSDEATPADSPTHAH